MSYPSVGNSWQLTAPRRGRVNFLKNQTDTYYSASELLGIYFRQIITKCLHNVCIKFYVILFMIARNFTLIGE